MPHHRDKLAGLYGKTDILQRPEIEVPGSLSKWKQFQEPVGGTIIEPVQLRYVLDEDHRLPNYTALATLYAIKRLRLAPLSKGNG